MTALYERVMKLKEKYMKYHILIWWLLLMSITAYAQTGNDSILLNERKIDRPLTLHKGQLQFNTAYEFSIISQEYDNNNKSINRADMGTASIMHKYSLELNYGLLDFLQITVDLNYTKRGERKETRQLYSPDYEINYFDDYKGFEDLFIGTVLKLPLKSKKFELALSPGIYVPLFSNRPEAPEHNISLIDGDLPIIRIVYYNNHKIATETAAIKIGASSIFRASKDFSVSAKLNYSWPVSESESIIWINQLNGSSFIYYDIPYRFLIDNTLDYEVTLAYQAISWFNISLSYFHKNKSSGWSEITGFRIGNPESGLSLLSIGYEIKASRNLWISEFIDIPLGGRNHLGPFSIYLGISYNFFPLNKN